MHADKLRLFPVDELAASAYRHHQVALCQMIFTVLDRRECLVATAAEL
ncbi:hypothetical protein [Nocardia abscessus]|nr:hypothetical protein [Nocardia abscessus]